MTADSLTTRRPMACSAVSWRFRWRSSRASSARSSARSISSTSNGFGTYSYAPALMARTASRSDPRAVRRMTGKVSSRSRTARTRAIASPRRHARKRDPHARPLPRLALVPHRPTVLLDHRSREHDAEARSVVTRREEWRADAPQRVGRHSAPGVAHDDLGLVPRGPHLDGDLPAGRSGLDAVGDEVQEGFLEAMRIGVQRRVALGVQPDASVVCARREHDERVRDERPESDAPGRHSLERAREREVVLEDLLHPRDLALHDL